MIFLTVGTLFSFDRLTKAVDDAVGAGLIDEYVFAQIGQGAYKPKNIEWTNIFDKDDFDRKVINAKALLSHAGIGSISMALDNNKPILVMPRLKKYGEHVNNHQLGTARRFEELGHVLVAYNESQIPEKIEQLKIFTPKPRENQAHIIAERVGKYLNDLGVKRPDAI